MTLFSEEQSTMVSTWTTEIICKSARGGACTLETNVTDPDLDEDQDDYFDFCSELIIEPSIYDRYEVYETDRDGLAVDEPHLIIEEGRHGDQ